MEILIYIFLFKKKLNMQQKNATSKLHKQAFLEQVSDISWQVM